MHFSAPTAPASRPLPLSAAAGRIVTRCDAARQIGRTGRNHEAPLVGPSRAESTDYPNIRLMTAPTTSQARTLSVLCPWWPE